MRSILKKQTHNTCTCKNKNLINFCYCVRVNYEKGKKVNKQNKQVELKNLRV